MDTPYTFLQDPDFIEWRLFRTSKQEKYWETFRKNNPHLETAMDQAIEQFHLISMQSSLLSDGKKDFIYAN